MTFGPLIGNMAGYLQSKFGHRKSIKEIVANYFVTVSD